jgi:two-component system chemotaxis response regulator CheY
MPEMDGIEATRTLMTEFPSARVIMITSMGQEQMVLEALQAGAKGYLIKPYQEIKLYEAIQKACKRELTPEKLAEEVAARKAAAAKNKAGA